MDNVQALAIGVQAGIAAGRASRGVVAKLDSVNPASPDYYATRHSVVRVMNPKQPEYTRVEFVHGLTQAADLAENMASVYGILRNLKAHTVGGGPWPAVSLEHDFDEDGKLSEAITDILEDWFDDCDFFGRNSMTMSAVCRRIVCALRDAGSILLVFDNYMPTNSGKIIVVEACQYADLSETDLRAFWKDKGPGVAGIPFDEHRLVNGCVTDKNSVVVGYIWDTSTRYGYTANPKNCRWVSRGNCWMFANNRSAADYIPMPELLTPYNISQAAESLRNSEVIAAAKAAKINYAVEGGGAVQEAIPVGRSSEITTEEGEVLAKKLATGDTIPADYAQAVENATGSDCVAVPTGSKVTALETSKPKPSTQDHFKNIREEQGACLGAAASFASMKTGGSYTAAMNDRNMTAANMDMDRADIETGIRHLCVLRLIWEDKQNPDFDLGVIKQADRRWRKKIMFQWPKFRAINPLQEANAQTVRLQSGEENFIDMSGPGWKDAAKQRRREYEFYSDGEGIPTTAFESTPGAIGTTSPEMADPNAQPSADTGEINENVVSD